MSKSTKPIEIVEEEPGRRSGMSRVRHQVLVMSGKGGVGKTTVTINLASALSRRGYSVGIMDADIHGPTVPKMLGMSKHEILVGENGRMLPAVDPNGVKVLSIAFLLQDKDAAVIWRGPLKMSLLKKFVQEADWGELDLLFVDLPPGTGDEPLSVVELMPEADGAVIVSTPQEVALQSVRKSLSFAGSLELPVLGIVENMSGFICPKCGEISYIFGADGAKVLAESLTIPLLGSIPLDMHVAASGESGVPLPSASNPYDAVAEALLAAMGMAMDPGRSGK